MGMVSEGVKMANMDQDVCPKCGELGMPKWLAGSRIEKARKCRKCGHVEEKG